MNWINNVVRPRIRSFLKPKDESAENLWVKDPESGEMVFYRDLEANQWVVPNSGYHMKIKGSDRLKNFFDDGHYDTVALPAVAQDPLKFRDSKKYVDRLRESRTKTGLDDAVLVATGKLYGQDLTAAVQDFDFMGGSLGMAAGQAIITGLETAARRKTPFVLFAASGGARMQEGILSLMQMAKTSAALARLKAERVPYISVLLHPTTGGVAASFAMLGDLIIAEPKALISFAGPRVIEQTIRQKLPEGFQRSEFLLEHGIIDAIVPRREMKERLGRILTWFGGPRAEAKARPSTSNGASANGPSGAAANGASTNGTVRHKTAPP